MSVLQSLSVTQVSQNVESNYSTVRILWSSQQTGQSWNGYTRTAYYYVSVNGGAEVAYSVSYTLPKNTTKTILDINITVPHNADGTGSVKVRTWMDTDIYEGVVEKSQSLTLSTIPRASSMSVANGTLEKQQDISITKQDNSFTHTITWKCGTASGTICTKSSATTVSWTPSIELANQATQSTSASVSFTITTYKGNTAIGTKTASATYTIPENYVPVLLPTTGDLSGYLGQYGDGYYIQNHSRLSIDIESYSPYGAWIKSYNTTFDGKTYNTANVETPPISKGGELPLTITVTDSRGRTTTANSKIKVHEWYTPQIKALKAYRSNEDGTENPYGEYMSIKFSADFAPLGGHNNVSVWIEYKKADETQYEDEPVINGEDLDSTITRFVDYVYTFQADTTSSYDILFKIQDDFAEPVTKYISGPSVKKVWSFLKKGGEVVGFALNKLAEIEGVFDVGWQSCFSGGILHPVLKTNSDLDMCLTPKTYMLLSANTYVNAPETGVGMFLEIVGIEDGSLIQRVSIFDNVHPRQYERIHYSSTGWGEWICVRGDFVIEQGDKNGWTYRKWNSGIMECWKTLEYVTAINNQWGSLYLTPAGTERQSYPYPFVKKPVETVSVQGNAPVWVICASGGNGVNGTYQTARYHLCCPSTQTSNTHYMSYYAIGKWK